MIPLRYSNNATIKYPLSDFHEENIPNDILLNLSLNIPDGYVPVVSIIQTSEDLAFVAIEDETTHVLLGSVTVIEPLPARIYPLTMDVAGFGHIVFGPGLTDPYNSGNISVQLDPDTTVYTRALAPELEITVNGIQYDLSNVLRLAETAGIISITASGDKVYFDRNDANLTSAQIAGFVDLPGSLENPEDIITSIAGVKPDSEGNIDILFGSSDLHPDCPDIYTMTPKRTLEGRSPASELPLQDLAPRDYDPSYECADDPVDPGDPVGGPHVIQYSPIIDVLDANFVGVLYSTRGTPIVDIPGSIIDGGYPDTVEGAYQSVIDAIYPESVDDDYESIIDSEE